MAKSYVADSTPIAKLQPTINALIALAAREGYTQVLHVAYFPIEFGKVIHGGNGGATYARFYDIILLMEKSISKQLSEVMQPATVEAIEEPENKKEEKKA